MCSSLPICRCLVHRKYVHLVYILLLQGLLFFVVETKHHWLHKVTPLLHHSVSITVLTLHMGFYINDPKGRTLTLSLLCNDKKMTT